MSGGIRWRAPSEIVPLRVSIDLGQELTCWRAVIGLPHLAFEGIGATVEEALMSLVSNLAHDLECCESERAKMAEYVVWDNGTQRYVLRDGAV